jgi:16S rRNA G966 N2-methylase RsmD
MVATNIFKIYPELAPKALQNSAYNCENLYIRYSSWISPSDINGKTFLDIGSQYGQTAAYVLSNGAKEYVGLEILDQYVEESTQILQKYFKNQPWSILHTSVEKFVETNTKKFDVIFLGRVLYDISNLSMTVLSKISTMADMIVIESATPINFSYLKLKELMEKTGIINQIDPDEMAKIDHYLEYTHEFIEYVQSSSGDYPITVYSLGFLKSFFQRLGFNEDISPYELLKEKYSEEYGLEYLGHPTNKAKKFIVRYYRNTDKLKPLSRIQYEIDQKKSTIT